MKLKNKERGQSLTELAISFTFLMLIMSGAVDFGRAFYYYITLRDASTEGAVYGSVEPVLDTDFTVRNDGAIEAHARGASSTPIDLVNDPSVNVVVDFPNQPSPANGNEGICAGSGNTVSVTVSANFTFNMPFMGIFIPGSTITLWATTENTILTPAC